MEDQAKVRRIDSLSGKEFEHLVAQLLTCLGLEIESQSQGPDGGIDILAKSATDLVSGRYVVQCKRYSQNVGVGAVRDLLGVMSNDRSVNKGILITNAEFTKPALELAHGNPIELIGGSQLGRLLEKHLQERFEAGRQEALLPPSVDRFLKFIVSSFGSLKGMIDEQQVELDKGLTVRRPKTLRSDVQLGDFFRRNGDEFLAALTALTNQVAHFWSNLSSDQDQVSLQRGFSLIRETLAQMLKQQREFCAVDTACLQAAGGISAFLLAHKRILHALSASFGGIVDSAQGMLDNPDRFISGKANNLFNVAIDLTPVVNELGAELDRLRRSRSFPIWVGFAVILGLVLLGFIILAINPNA